VRCLVRTGGGAELAASLTGCRRVAAGSVLAVQLVGGREPSSARLITAPGDRGLYSHQDNLRVQMAPFPGFAAARWMDQPGSPCQVASGSQGVGWLES